MPGLILLGAMGWLEAQIGPARRGSVWLECEELI